MQSVLIVDDDPMILQVLGRGMRAAGYEVTTAPGGPEGIEHLEGRTFDALLVDLGMPEVDGFQVMRHALQNNRVRAVIVVTGQNSVPIAVEAMRTGAADFLTKPADPDKIAQALQRALGGAVEAEEHNRAVRAWRAELAPEIVGDSPALLDVLGIVHRVAETDCSVLITGESGTGKELIARLLHRASPRASAPFVAVNCAAIPKDLMESEIFGHARGAFTGATEKREGRFQVADGGTLFLDEVAEMESGLQGKFLRVLQEKEYTPVGESRARKADVRIVAATNKDLHDESRTGSFREDLYYRLNVLPIHVPPLRERRSDVKLLTQAFIAQANARHNRSVAGVDERVETLFGSYAWPGNVRELANLLERLVILKGGGTLQATDLPPGLTQVEPPAFDRVELPESGLNIKEAMERLEARLTTEALRRSNGNKAKAAEMLGLKRTTLIERLKRLQIPELSDRND